MENLYNNSVPESVEDNPGHLVFKGEKFLQEVKTVICNDAWHQAEKKFGQVVKIDDKSGEIKKINQLSLAFILSQVLEVVYIADENALLVKDTKRGLWLQPENQELETSVLTFVAELIKANSGVDLGWMATPALAKSLVKFLRSAPKNDFFAASHHNIIHCRNCFLKLEENGEITKLSLEDADIKSRHQLNVDYEPAARCPRFLNILLESAVSEDGIHIIKLYMGMCLTGCNTAQRVLFLSGAAGSGKSTLVNIIEMLLGRNNIGELRTNALNGRFETSRYAGKLLLTGKDVPSDFMQKQGASKLKALTGNDLVSTELKHSNASGNFQGNFTVIVTSNCTQPIHLEDDKEAWERRVLSVKFAQPAPGRSPIKELDKQLLEEEGPGILNFALDGLKEVRANGGMIMPTPEQKEEINKLIRQSEDLKTFLAAKIETIPNDVRGQCENTGITSDEIYLRYKDFCKEKEWPDRPHSKIVRELPDAMFRMFNSAHRTDVKRNGTNHRGYFGVRWKQDQD